MDPFTLLALGGTAVNVIGKLMGSSSEKAIDLNKASAFDVNAQAYDTRGMVDDLNAKLLGGQADVAGLGVDFAASKERQALGKIAESGRQTLATQRSYFAGGNLDPTFGSPLQLQAVTAGRISTDMEITKASFAIDRANALTTEANLRGQAAGAAGSAVTDSYSAAAARLSAASERSKGDADMTAGYLGAGTALLSGLSTAGKGSGLFGGSGGTLGSMQVGDQFFPAYGA